jgi:hypothetical protein
MPIARHSRRIAAPFWVFKKTRRDLSLVVFMLTSYKYFHAKSHN